MWRVYVFLGEAEIPILGRSLLRVRDISPMACQRLTSVSCIWGLAVGLTSRRSVLSPLGVFLG